MNQLLSKDPDVRIGGSFKALKADPWFEGIFWVEQNTILFISTEI
jgi:hypothetical protein